MAARKDNPFRPTPEEMALAPRLIRSDMSLERATLWVNVNRWDGCTCPCSGQHCEVYDRPLGRVGAQTLRDVVVLTELHRRYPDMRLPVWAVEGRYPFMRPHCHLARMVTRRFPDDAHQGGEKDISRHWGLLTEERIVRPDGGRAGWWYGNRKAEDFVNGHSKIPRLATCYNDTLIGLWGPLVTFEDCLGHPFDLREILQRGPGFFEEDE